MNNYLIREMRIDDFDKMIDLWKRTPGLGLNEADSVESISKFLARNTGLSFICEMDDKIVATLLCGHDGRRGYIYHLAVDESFRRKGIARKLMDQSLEKIHQQGIKKCHLFLYTDNVNAVKFYEKTGWKRRHNLLIYSKDL